MRNGNVINEYVEANFKGGDVRFEVLCVGG